MILESLIKDDSMLTLDCAKARIKKGDTVEIDDQHWHDPEIQGALKLKMVRVVGKKPNVPPLVDQKDDDPKQEKTKTFVSAAGNRMAFECKTKYKDPNTGEPLRWKEWVDPGNPIHVPLSAVEDKQIQNALGWELLVDPEAKKKKSPKAKKGKSVVLEEAKVAPGKSTRRKKSKAKSPVKAKKISSVADSDSDIDSELFEPSTLHEPPEFSGPDLDELLSGKDEPVSAVQEEVPQRAPEKPEKDDNLEGSFLELFGTGDEDSTDEEF